MRRSCASDTVSLAKDVTYSVGRLPRRDETLAGVAAPAFAVGGKGANQAAAAARLGAASRLVARFGRDAAGARVREALEAEGVDLSASVIDRDGTPTGQGVILLEPDGAATSLVVGGANAAWSAADTERAADAAAAAAAAALRAGAGAAVLLQREVPDKVSLAVARRVREAAPKALLLLDIGGEDRPIGGALLGAVDVVAPNEGELERLTGLSDIHSDTHAVVAAAQTLIDRGARAVLVTLGARGAVLLMRRQKGEQDVPLWQRALLPPAAVRDATAAGDAFRAAFAVATSAGASAADAMRLAAAAGAIAVTREGAMPSLPRRDEAYGLAGLEQEQWVLGEACLANDTENAVSAGTGAEVTPQAHKDRRPPLLPPLASRLNSMRARSDLLPDGEAPADVLGLLARQARVRGLSLADLNYPQHLEGRTPAEVRRALVSAGLRAGAVALRFPEAQFRQGVMAHFDSAVRDDAVSMAVKGCEWAQALNASDVVIWPQFDGFDYHFQADYVAMADRAADAYAVVADRCGDLGVRVSLEPKPTDEKSRFGLLGSTAAALRLVERVGRPNFGLTLDVGHMLLAGENPAQSAAETAAAGRLFGLHLGDAHVRLGAEDGLAFASIHADASLELVYWLQRSSFGDAGEHLYFDTFPLNEDPVAEAEANVEALEALWDVAARLDDAGLAAAIGKHDALGAREALRRAKRVTMSMA